MGYGLINRGSFPGKGMMIFSSPQGPGRLWGPPIQWEPGSLFTELKRPGREADHSPPLSHMSSWSDA
jgi:hypothetical protein